MSSSVFFLSYTNFPVEDNLSSAVQQKFNEKRIALRMSSQNVLLFREWLPQQWNLLSFEIHSHCDIQNRPNSMIQKLTRDYEVALAQKHWTDVIIFWQ